MTNRAYRLLIVEDNEDDLYLILRALGQKAPPHVATCCRDADEALRMLGSMDQAPDLLVFDMILPRQDGVDLLAEIRKRPATSNIPAIVLTTSGDPGRTMAAVRLGGTVVPKPVQYEAFLETVGQAVQHALRDLSANR